MNWNCVLLAGFTVTAAVLDDQKALAEAAAWLPVAEDHFQKDGSYGESIQYANYAAYSIMLTHEALIRKSLLKTTSFEPYARIVNWASYALFYRKPLSGWPVMDWPRSANFGDAAAVFRPSGDLLVHIAARARKELPLQAGLASWLFNTLYFPANEPGPHDLASFGFVNGFGFLSVIMLADAAPHLLLRMPPYLSQLHSQEVMPLPETPGTGLPRSPSAFLQNPAMHPHICTVILTVLSWFIIRRDFL